MTEINLHSEALRRAQAFLLLLAGAATGPILFVVNPATSPLFPPCPLRWATGWLCPGCGSLRAMHQLLHGEVAAAFALNPLMLMLLPLTIFLLAQHLVSVLRPRAFERALPATAVWALLLLTVTYAVARNLPHGPAALSAAAFR